MMRRHARTLIGLAIALALAGTAWAMQYTYSSGAAGLLIGAVNTNTPFTDNRSGGTAAAFRARFVKIKSAGPNTCHYDLLDGVATTADPRIEPGETIIVDFDTRPHQLLGGTLATEGFARFGAICVAAQTATFYVDAWR